MLLAYENAAKGQGAQGVIERKKKIIKIDCGMTIIEQPNHLIIDELSFYDGFFCWISNFI